MSQNPVYKVATGAYAERMGTDTRNEDIPADKIELALGGEAPETVIIDRADVTALPVPTMTADELDDLTRGGAFDSPYEAPKP